MNEPPAHQRFFADGVSEGLLNLLARVPELRVSARTSSFAFQGKDLPVPVIADRLGVAHVLEGSVRKAGEEVRITAQPIRAEDGYQVWSDTWDRTLEDVFAVQDEIVADVVDRLQVTFLDEAPTVEETDPEAYALVLRAAPRWDGGPADPEGGSIRTAGGRGRSHRRALPAVAFPAWRLRGTRASFISRRS